MAQEKNSPPLRFAQSSLWKIIIIILACSITLFLILFDVNKLFILLPYMLFLILASIVSPLSPAIETFVSTRNQNIETTPLDPYIILISILYYSIAVYAAYRTLRGKTVKFIPLIVLIILLIVPTIGLIGAALFTSQI